MAKDNQDPRISMPRHGGGVSDLGGEHHLPRNQVSSSPIITPTITIRAIATAGITATAAGITAAGITITTSIYTASSDSICDEELRQRSNILCRSNI